MFISPLGILLFLGFPLYVIFRLESISRRLRRLEERPREGLRSDLRAHNARVVEEWERRGREQPNEAQTPGEERRNDSKREGEQ
ncbi:hypothetical protein ACP26L_03125 [Paenibacillus sp. S-38]|uniref:hypothetical protein n=1 Tax=Paenibacillus sp. S-38 TaxID=3416710 RepID=UPI003CEA99EB